MDIIQNDNGRLLKISENKRSTHNTIFNLSVKLYDDKKCLFLDEGNVEYRSPSVNSRLICFTTCVDIYVDINIPVILLEIECDKYFDYHLIGFSLEKKQSILLRKLQTKQKIENFKVIDGPNIVWYSESEESLFIGKSSQRNPSCLSKLLIESSICETNLLWTKYYTHYYFILGNLERKNTDEKELFVYVCCQSSTAHDKVVKCEPSQIISTLYTNVCNIVISQLEITCEDNDSFSFMSIVFAMTKDGYILKFENGRIQFAITTNIACDLDIQMIFLKCISINKSYLSIYTSSSSTLTVFSVENEKIMHSWSNIKQVLCDDFIGNGSDQLLILSEEFNYTTGFIITNLDIDTTNRRHDKEQTTEETKSNTITAVNALQSRLRNEVVSLNELQSNIVQRKWHITDMWKRTESLNHGNLIPDINNTTMVNLTGPDNSSQSMRLENRLEDKNIYLKVYNVWKRIVQRNLIVGIEVGNVSKSDIIYAAVTLVPPAGSQDPAVLTFTSECYGLEKSSWRSATHNHSKKQKISPLSLSNISDMKCVQLQPGKLATIVCKTSLPSFSKATHSKYEVFIHLVDNLESSCDRDKKIIFGGEITLSTLDILGEQDVITVIECAQQDSTKISTPTELQEDILALNTVQFCTALCARSTRFPLYQLQSWLQKRTGLSFSQKYECMVSTSIKSLEDVRLYIDEENDGEKIGMTVYTRCKNQLYLLLHHMYAVLPDDVIILPNNQSHLNISELLDSLLQEISSVSSGISQVYNGRQLCEDVKMNEELDENKKLVIENVQKNFAKRKLLIQSKSKLSIGGDEFSKLTCSMEQFQLKSDINLIKLKTQVK